ncbi:MAG: glycoside hydrolase family 127 protein, partial [Dysgonamonadaceae bacterium]|nr:glycoside hydrolase family 127 protein [Dysgonamonadaceae bacterium]
PSQDGYVEITRNWKKGDKITLDFSMETRTVEANPLVTDDAGKYAVERGPIVYCSEKPLEVNASDKINYPDFLKPAQVLTFNGQTLIPYYSWSNRGASEMAVWMENNYRQSINLSGIWQFGDGSEDFILPGTTDTNKKGMHNTKKDETMHLSRIYSFVGKARYKKEITIPAEWKNKNITLTLERTKPSEIWIDGKFVGSNDNISTSQVYELTKFLTPGRHELAIIVDNANSVPPQLLENSHAYTESTQTNWNGIIGKIFLEASNALYISDIQLFPDAKQKLVKIKVKISSPEKLNTDSRLIVNAYAWNTEKKHSPQYVEYKLIKSKGEYELDYPLGDDALLWSEFQPALYRLNVELKGIDNKIVSFGLRNFETQGLKFTVNGNIIWLRGKHDACVFPLTAHTAMDLATWRHYFQVAKSYGINHYRFHSWCPPEACFEAADIEGIYLQPELPFWGSLHKDSTYLVSFLRKEGVNIQREYGNHASFVMFALGNELSGDFEVMESLVNTFREVDNRHLYAYGSNNYLGYRGHLKGEDYLTTCRIGGEETGKFNTHVRGSFSFADTYDGGYINHTYPNTIMNFSTALAKSAVPVISHESGQFQIYPDYKQITKYKGVLYPWNLEIFRKRLESAGMAEQADDFFRASGKWAVQLYKAEIEMDLRTPELAGFQLLDLQDYPGQGSAYVGILDAFMDSKGLIEPQEWRSFCSETVPLFLTEKFCWKNSENLTGTIKIANYSPNYLNNKEIKWELKELDGKSFQHGILRVPSLQNASQAGLIEVGQIFVPFSSIKKATRLNLEIKINDTELINHYPIWVYPSDNQIVKSDEITVVKDLNQEILAKLKKSEKILWFPRREQVQEITVGGLFQTDYWNYRMFKNISESNKKPISPGTLGILTNHSHPIFKNFPTDFHTNWQWFSIVKNSYPLILDNFPVGYKPVVQVIDNIERNHKLGLIFEVNIDGSKLLVCMSDLDADLEQPEVKQLYNSILQYMKSDEFQPETRLSSEDLFDKLLKYNKL